MDKPNLDKNISHNDFNEFYWLKQERADFCKNIGISTSGVKIKIDERIRHYLSTGELLKTETLKIKPTSKFNRDKEKLTRETIITDNYKNGKNIKSFFYN